MGHVPTDSEGLDALVHAPADQTEWLGPYLARDQIPNDPWGRPYQYSVDARSGAFTIVSFGSDGQRGGSGSAADISSQDNAHRRQGVSADTVERAAP